jgi:hypothetical protein
MFWRVSVEKSKIFIYWHLYLSNSPYAIFVLNPCRTGYAVAIFDG